MSEAARGRSLLSRSRMRNRNRAARSPRSISRFRASWPTQAPAGWAVIPAAASSVRRSAASAAGRAAASQRVEQGAVHPRQQDVGFPAQHRDTSWHRTRISTSFAESDRASNASQLRIWASIRCAIERPRLALMPTGSRSETSGTGRQHEAPWSGQLRPFWAHTSPRASESLIEPEPRSRAAATRGALHGPTRAAAAQAVGFGVPGTRAVGLPGRERVQTGRARCGLTARRG
jgi:hypothetical protein